MFTLWEHIFWKSIRHSRLKLNIHILSPSMNMLSSSFISLFIHSILENIYWHNTLEIQQLKIQQNYSLLWTFKKIHFTHTSETFIQMVMGSLYIAAKTGSKAKVHRGRKGKYTVACSNNGIPDRKNTWTAKSETTSKSQVSAVSVPVL